MVVAEAKQKQGERALKVENVHRTQRPDTDDAMKHKTMRCE